MKKDKHGGERSGAGRPPIAEEERKVTLTIYPKKKDIAKCGGIEQAKKIALQAVENYSSE